MKHIRIIFLFVFVFASFTACDNEPLDGDFVIDSGTNNGNNNGSEESGGESTGDYWPMAIGNNWLYSLVQDGIPQDDYDMTISDLVTYNGNQSYLYENFIGNTTATDGTGFEDFSLNFHTRKNGGDYYIEVGELTASLLGMYNITQNGYSFIILKDYLEIGGAWSVNAQTVTAFESMDSNFPDLPSQTINLTLNFEIIDKDMSITVNDQNYASVIKVKYVQDSSIVGAPDQSTHAEYYYYFAKDIGLIKAEGTAQDIADNITSTVLQELESYTLN